MAQPFLIGLAGISCSGKTTIAAALVKALSPERAVAIGIDAYYHDLSHLSAEAVTSYNLDEPAALEVALLTSHLRSLAAGDAIDKPVYDYKTHSRAAHSEPVDAHPVVLVEGLFVLHWPEVREMFGLSVFIDVPHDISLARRIARDRNQRGRTAEEVSGRYDAMVRPMADRYVIPTKTYANLVVDGTATTEQIVKEILTALSEKRKGR